MHRQSADTLFHALGDATRRGLFEQLARGGALSVGALRMHAGVSQPAVSQHLKTLRDAGLVSHQRCGRNVFYRAKPAGLRHLIDWLAFYGAFWPERFDRLEKLLREMDQ